MEAHGAVSCTSCTGGVFWAETEGRGKVREKEEFSSAVCEASVCEHTPDTGCFVLKGFFSLYFCVFRLDWASFKSKYLCIIFFFLLKSASNLPFSDHIRIFFFHLSGALFRVKLIKLNIST